MRVCRVQVDAAPRAPQARDVGRSWVQNAKTCAELFAPELGMGVGFRVLGAGFRFSGKVLGFRF